MLNRSKLVRFTRPNGEWVKEVTGVDRSKVGTFALEGGFLSRGRQEFEMPLGTVLLVYTVGGSRKHPTRLYTLWVVFAGGVGMVRDQQGEIERYSEVGPSFLDVIENVLSLDENDLQKLERRKEAALAAKAAQEAAERVAREAHQEATRCAERARSAQNALDLWIHKDRTSNTDVRFLARNLPGGWTYPTPADVATVVAALDDVAGTELMDENRLYRALNAVRTLCGASPLPEEDPKVLRARELRAEIDKLENRLSQLRSDLVQLEAPVPV